jgi:hypothetical protein
MFWDIFSFVFDNTDAGGMVLLQTEDIKHFYIPFLFYTFLVVIIKMLFLKVVRYRNVFYISFVQLELVT